MNSLQTIFVPMLFLSISPVFNIVLEEKSELDEMDYDWDTIQEHVRKYTLEQNEYATSQGGWLEIYKRQQAEKQTRKKRCPSISDEEIRAEHERLRARVITFYTLENYGGEHMEEITRDSCDRFHQRYRNNIKSFKLQGNCVQLCRRRRCEQCEKFTSDVPDLLALFPRFRGSIEYFTAC